MIPSFLAMGMACLPWVHQCFRSSPDATESRASTRLIEVPDGDGSKQRVAIPMARLVSNYDTLPGVSAPWRKNRK